MVAAKLALYRTRLIDFLSFYLLRVAVPLTRSGYCFMGVLGEVSEKNWSGLFQDPDRKQNHNGGFYFLQNVRLNVVKHSFGR